MPSHTRRGLLKLGAGAVALSGTSNVVGAGEIIKTEEFVYKTADSHQQSSEDACATTGEWTKFADSARLPDGTTTYRLEPNNVSVPVEQPVNASFETWANVAEGINFARDSSSTTVVKFVPLGLPGPLGFAYVRWRKWPGPQRIVQFEISINTDHNLGNLAPNPVCDSESGEPFNVQDIVTHEIGHAIGLSHTASEESNGNTMGPFGYAGSTFASTLAEGDKNGARALYHED